MYKDLKLTLASALSNNKQQLLKKLRVAALTELQLTYLKLQLNTAVK
jgi:hypothetical protein